MFSIVYRSALNEHADVHYLDIKSDDFSLLSIFYYKICREIDQYIM
jgi:hypothetical protein